MTSVLVVEDENDVLEIVREALERRGLEVRTADSDRSAFSILEAEPRSFDVLVADINLGEGVTGFDIARRARQLQPDLQVVYILADAGGTRVDSPPPVARNNAATLVRQVEVTIIARSMPGNFQGETDPAGGPTAALPRALRQHLRTTTVARAVLLSMGQQTPRAWN